MRVCVVGVVRVGVVVVSGGGVFVRGVVGMERGFVSGGWVL